jgi:archaemetzincin
MARNGDPDEGPGMRTLCALRTVMTATHETGHMFGIWHCIYYRCVMNGANHLEEDDRGPLHLCPVCLRKLQWSAGFDVVKRYRELERVCRAAGLTEEAGWVAREVGRVEGTGR